MVDTYIPGEDRGAGMTDEAHRLVPIGHELLRLIDYLIDQRAPEQLEEVDGLIIRMEVADVWARDLDLLSLGEYAETAAEYLREGHAPDEIKASDYRKRAAMANTPVYGVLEQGDGSQSEKRHALITYLKQQPARRDADPDDELDIVYEIAGLRFTRFAQSLSQDDPLSEILHIATQLEIPSEWHWDETSWNRLAKRIEALPQ